VSGHIATGAAVVEVVVVVGGWCGDDPQAVSSTELSARTPATANGRRDRAEPTGCWALIERQSLEEARAKRVNLPERLIP
jgi:hypothetical protein